MLHDGGDWARAAGANMFNRDQAGVELVKFGRVRSGPLRELCETA